MKLKLNREYAHRHLFVILLMSGLGCWFGYDGLVRYPSLSAGDLYRLIEKSEPKPQTNLEKFKRQKIQTQYGFTILSLLAALIVGLRLAKSAMFEFEFDKSGFTCGGRKYIPSDVESVDLSSWEKDSILVLKMKDGRQIKLDAWHHKGVKEFAESQALRA